MSKLLTFNNDPKLKARLVERMKQHAEADEIIQGIYWEDGKGCHIGCLMESDEPHSKVKEIGLDNRLTYLMDAIFEGLPNDEAQIFARDTIAKIPVGVDSFMIYCEFMVWLLKRVSKHTEPKSQQRKAIAKVIGLYEQTIDGEIVAEKEWVDAAAAAGAAAWAVDAAWAAAWAADAAWAAAWAADAAGAADAARAVAWAAAAAEYKAMANKLYEILEETKDE